MNKEDSKPKRATRVIQMPPNYAGGVMLIVLLVLATYVYFSS